MQEEKKRERRIMNVLFLKGRHSNVNRGRCKYNTYDIRVLIQFEGILDRESSWYVIWGVYGNLILKSNWYFGSYFRKRATLQNEREEKI